jgi:hypothetical protein
LRPKSDDNFNPSGDLAELQKRLSSAEHKALIE